MESLKKILATTRPLVAADFQFINPYNIVRRDNDLGTQTHFQTQTYTDTEVKKNLATKVVMKLGEKTRFEQKHLIRFTLAGIGLLAAVCSGYIGENEGVVQAPGATPDPHVYELINTERTPKAVYAGIPTPQVQKNSTLAPRADVLIQPAWRQGIS